MEWIIRQKHVRAHCSIIEAARAASEKEDALGGRFKVCEIEYERNESETPVLTCTLDPTER